MNGIFRVPGISEDDIHALRDEDVRRSLCGLWVGDGTIIVTDESVTCSVCVAKMDARAER